jgi:hypothetical protein
MNWCTSKFLFAIVLVLTIVVLGGFSISDAIETTIKKIVADKNSYDGKEVSVSGTVSANLKFKTSKGGKDYTTFSLIGDTGGRINVFVWGKSKLHGGQKVRVTGIYHKVMRVGQSTFRNEIEATEIQEL